MIIVIISILLCFIPIPLKFHLIYKNKNIEIFFYSIKLNFNKNKISFANSSSKKNNFKFKTIIDFISYINDFKIKFSLKSHTNINIGIDDAALLGIVYGLINLSIYPLYKIIEIFFKVSQLNININPYFNKKILFLDNISIIYVSLAKIIYISFKILYFYISTIKGGEAEYKFSL